MTKLKRISLRCGRNGKRPCLSALAAQESPSRAAMPCPCCRPKSMRRIPKGIELATARA